MFVDGDARARDATLARVRDVDGETSDASGSERDGSEGRAVADGVGGFRSVLTRKPSIAAIKAMVDLDAVDGEAVSGESDDDEGEAEDEGVCSLSEFAMVLNAAAWVRVRIARKSNRGARFVLLTCF